MIKKMGFPGYLLIVWDFIRYAREEHIPVGPGRGSAAGSLVAWCMRITDVDPIDFDLHLRALPQPRAHLDARHRRRLLRAAPRRGHRLRHAEVRPRERRADHHVRDDEGEGRRARRRARARDAVRRRRSHREADSAGARHDARQGARREPDPQGHGGEGPEGQGGPRHRPPPRGDVAPRLGARRRRRHRAGADHRLRAALQGGARRNHDAVEHEGGRARRPPEDGFPRPEHADAHRRRAEGDQADRGDRPRHRQHPARRRRRPTRCSPRAPPTASSSSRARGCASCCARRSPTGSTT